VEDAGASFTVELVHGPTLCLASGI
jgi:hypothetical protein